MDDTRPTIHLKRPSRTSTAASRGTNLSDPDGIDYEPSEHRMLENPTTNMETLFHLLRVGIGTGILAIPQAFANAGLITGVICTILVGLLVTHCLRVLVVSQYYTCKLSRAPLLVYPESVKVAIASGPTWTHFLSKPSACAVDLFVIVYQIGVCCVYIIFIGDNLKKLIDPYREISVEMHMLFILLPLIALNLIPNLKLLAPLSGVGNILAAASIIIIIYFLATGKKSSQPVDYWGSMATFPLFFGTVVFALTSVGVVVAISSNMKTPKAFWATCGVLDVGMLIIVIFFLGIGVSGYIFCVSECSDSITLDLPKNNGLATAAVVLYTLSIFISYSLNCYVPVDIIWKLLLKPFLERRSVTKFKVYEYILRIVLCIFTFFLAVSIPRLGLFISLFGAFCLSALGFIFPALMEACLEYGRPPRAIRRCVFGKDILVMIIGLIGLISGTYASLRGIVQSFN